MNKADALASIKEAWGNDSISLGDKITQVSSAFYGEGLDLAGTAAYLHTTESELRALLDLSEFDDNVIDRISKVNPPKTTWAVLASASDEEVEYALDKLASTQANGMRPTTSVDEYVYQAMIEVSGPTVEQKVTNLSGDVLKHALKKGEDFGKLGDWDKKFLKSVSVQKKQGKVLTERQGKQLVRILTSLVEAGAITHHSIDGDQEICDQILEALEM